MQISNEQKNTFRKDWENSLKELLDSLDISKKTQDKILKNKAKLYEFLRQTEHLSFFSIDIKND